MPFTDHSISDFSTLMFPTHKMMLIHLFHYYLLSFKKRAPLYFISRDLPLNIKLKHQLKFKDYQNITEQRIYVPITHLICLSSLGLIA